jgi:hypothetical protein
VDSCVGLPRLYETVVQEGQGGGWEGVMVVGWAGRLSAGGWDGIRCVLGGAHLKKHTLLKVNTVTKKAMRRYLMFLG